MGNAVIFSGNSVKALKSSIALSGGATIHSITVDPTVSATQGNIGDIAIRTGTPNLYQKTVATGTDTNWWLLTGGGAGAVNPTITTDSFTGDNVITAFTLSVNPAAEQNTSVFLDGVYQHKSTYSVSGTTLTFSAPPPIDVAVEVNSVTYGSIIEGPFTAANNQAVAADVGGLMFSNATVRAFEATVSVSIDATADLFEMFTLRGIQRTSDWQMSVTSVGDNSLFVFTITNTGQVQYVGGNYPGFTSATLRFKSVSTSV